MLSLLAVLTPIGLAGAISPVLLTEQSVLLSGPGGKRVASIFAAGAILLLSALVFVLVAFGQVIALPKAPRLSGGMDIALGVLLLALVLYLHRRAARQTEPKSNGRSGLNPRAAFFLGMAAMVTNFTTIVLMVPGAKEIAVSDVEAIGRALAGAYLVTLASLPAWLPVALARVAPNTADRVLGSIRRGIDRHGKAATSALIGAVGVYLIAKGSINVG